MWAWCSCACPTCGRGCGCYCCLSSPFSSLLLALGPPTCWTFLSLPTGWSLECMSSGQDRTPGPPLPVPLSSSPFPAVSARFEPAQCVWWLHLLFLSVVCCCFIMQPLMVRCMPIIRALGRGGSQGLCSTAWPGSHPSGTPTSVRMRVLSLRDHPRHLQHLSKVGLKAVPP